MVDRINSLASIAGLGMLAFSMNAQALPPSYYFQTGISTDDVGNQTEVITYVAGLMQYSHKLSNNRVASFRAEIFLNDYDQSDALSGEELFLEAGYHYTPGAGFRVPTYTVALRQEEEFRDQSNLDASVTSLIFSVGYRIDDSTSVSGGIRLGERDAATDSSSTNYFVNLDYSLNLQWLIYSSIEINDADLDTQTGATATSPAPGFSARSFYSATHLTSPSATSNGASFASYDSNSIRVGATYVIDGFNNIDMSYNRSDYDTSNGSSVSNILSLDYFHRF